MSEDKELVDAWICEFWGLVERSPDSIKNSEFNQIRLEGFLMAKRSQSVVELPKDCHVNNSTIFRNGFQSALRAVKQNLTAAGIKYTIGELLCHKKEARTGTGGNLAPILSAMDFTGQSGQTAT